MKKILWLIAILTTLTMGSVSAQVNKWRDMYKVKKKDTVFGISQKYGITTAELMDANPEMKAEGYQLKKGDYIFIPYSQNDKHTTPPATPAKKQTAVSDTRDELKKRAIRMGVMLPLHDVNGDGRRMVEYYRGVLMACDSLKQEGISIDIKAWNTDDHTDVGRILQSENTKPFDVIIGPLYSSQVPDIANYAAKHQTKVLIPFSINAPILETNSHLYQVYQQPDDFNNDVIATYLKRFKGCHTVIIDCNDSTSKKGVFTSALRKQLDKAGFSYSITNLTSNENLFAKAFSSKQPNVVVLNTGRSPELNVAFAKLNNLVMSNQELKITLFGYTEWMMYTKYNLDNYYKFNVHIPAAFYTNPLSSKTARIEKKYRWNFHADMMQALPRFAITGFDHAYFFLKGLYTYGTSFTGAAGTLGYQAIQTPLRFQRVGTAGGWQNKALLLVNYTPEHRIDTIEY